jgi:hypothetical protein
MPILEISRDELGPRRGRATLVYIQAVMLWPEAPPARHLAFAAFDATRIRDALNEAPDDLFPTPDQMRELLAFVSEAPRLRDITEDSKKALFSRHSDGTGPCRDHSPERCRTSASKSRRCHGSRFETSLRR